MPPRRSGCTKHFRSKAPRENSRIVCNPETMLTARGFCPIAAELVG